MTSEIYKILTLDDDAAFAAAPDPRSGGGYGGSGDDRRDGFIHLSTAEQLAGTLRAHYAALPQVMLLTVSVAALSPERLKWEPSRGGQLFPHYYDVLPGAAILRRDLLERAASGEFHLPWETR